VQHESETGRYSGNIGNLNNKAKTGKRNALRLVTSPVMILAGSRQPTLGRSLSMNKSHGGDLSSAYCRLSTVRCPLLSEIQLVPASKTDTAVACDVKVPDRKIDCSLGSGRDFHADRGNDGEIGLRL